MSTDPSLDRRRLISEIARVACNWSGGRPSAASRPRPRAVSPTGSDTACGRQVTARDHLPAHQHRRARVWATTDTSSFGAHASTDHLLARGVHPRPGSRLFRDRNCEGTPCASRPKSNCARWPRTPMPSERCTPQAGCRSSAIGSSAAIRPGSRRCPPRPISHPSGTLPGPADRPRRRRYPGVIPELTSRRIGECRGRPSC